MGTQHSGIYIALGANLAATGYATPRDTLEGATAALAVAGIAVLRRSSWWRSAPLPLSDQPDFINGVIEISTVLDPSATLDLLHRIEADFGRVRQQRWEARVLDLDLIDYLGQVLPGGPDVGGRPVLPHPRLAERLFVLLPLQELAPDWCHPVSGLKISDLVSAAIPININRL